MVNLHANAFERLENLNCSWFVMSSFVKNLNICQRVRVVWLARLLFFLAIDFLSTTTCLLNMLCSRIWVKLLFKQVRLLIFWITILLNFILKFVEDKLWIFPSTGVPIRKFEMYQSRVLWNYYESTWLVHPKLRGAGPFFL